MCDDDELLIGSPCSLENPGGASRVRRFCRAWKPVMAAPVGHGRTDASRAGFCRAAGNRRHGEDEASIAFRVAFDGFEIGDRLLTLTFLANGERHVQQGIFEVFPCFLIEKCLRAPEVFKEIFVSPDNSGISRRSQRRSGMVVDASWIQRRRGGTRKRHIDVLQIRAGIGVEVGRAYVVAGRSAGRLGQHPAARRVVCEGTESPLIATDCKHHKRHQEQSQPQQPSRCASALHRPPPGLNSNRALRMNSSLLCRY
jgi:hypothetical protein